MIFIVSIEGYITVTSLVSITRDLGGFHEVSWIVSSYQLGFVGQCLSPLSRAWLNMRTE